MQRQKEQEMLDKVQINDIKSKYTGNKIFQRRPKRKTNETKTQKHMESKDKDKENDKITNSKVCTFRAPIPKIEEFKDCHSSTLNLKRGSDSKDQIGKLSQKENKKVRNSSMFPDLGFEKLSVLQWWD